MNIKVCNAEMVLMMSNRITCELNAACGLDNIDCLVKFSRPFGTPYRLYPISQNLSTGNKMPILYKLHAVGRQSPTFTENNNGTYVYIPH